MNSVSTQPSPLLGNQSLLSKSRSTWNHFFNYCSSHKVAVMGAGIPVSLVVTYFALKHFGENSATNPIKLKSEQVVKQVDEATLITLEKISEYSKGDVFFQENKNIGANESGASAPWLLISAVVASLALLYLGKKFYSNSEPTIQIGKAIKKNTVDIDKKTIEIEEKTPAIDLTAEIEEYVDFTFPETFLKRHPEEQLQKIEKLIKEMGGIRRINLDSLQTTNDLDNFEKKLHSLKKIRDDAQKLRLIISREKEINFRAFLKGKSLDLFEYIALEQEITIYKESLNSFKESIKSLAKGITCFVISSNFLKSKELSPDDFTKEDDQYLKSEYFEEQFNNISIILNKKPFDLDDIYHLYNSIGALQSRLERVNADLTKFRKTFNAVKDIENLDNIAKAKKKAYESLTLTLGDVKEKFSILKESKILEISFMKENLEKIEELLSEEENSFNLRKLSKNIASVKKYLEADFKIFFADRKYFSDINYVEMIHKDFSSLLIIIKTICELVEKEEAARKLIRNLVKGEILGIENEAPRMILP